MSVLSYRPFFIHSLLVTRLHSILCFVLTKIHSYFQFIHFFRFFWFFWNFIFDLSSSISSLPSSCVFIFLHDTNDVKTKNSVEIHNLMLVSNLTKHCFDTIYLLSWTKSGLQEILKGEDDEAVNYFVGTYLCLSVRPCFLSFFDFILIVWLCYLSLCCIVSIYLPSFIYCTFSSMLLYFLFILFQWCLLFSTLPFISLLFFTHHSLLPFLCCTEFHILHPSVTHRSLSSIISLFLIQISCHA